MKTVYFPKRLQHPKTDEYNIALRSGTYGEFQLFLRTSKYYKIDVFHRNLHLSHTISNIWPVEEFRRAR